MDARVMVAGQHGAVVSFVLSGFQNPGNFSVKNKLKGLPHNILQ
jgi:hypothetical protein